MTDFQDYGIPSIEDIKRKKKEFEAKAKIAGENSIRVIGDATVMADYGIDKETLDRIKKDVDRFFDRFGEKLV